MSHLSIAEIRRILGRHRSSDRYTDALLAVTDHTGLEIFRVGGRWDGRLGMYVGGATVAPHVFRCEESQEEAMRGVAGWLDATRRNDETRPVLLILAGDRGSGKTHMLAALYVICALE